MNDPNGLVFYKGEYHLFYQHNPFGQTWGHMSWGHAVSRDMLQWEHLPVALREEDGVMIFSGSAVVDWNNTSGFCVPVGQDRSCLVAIYTGHSPGKQTQNLAFSNDRGRTWTKYASNPVVDLGLSDFRDPKVFWHAPTSRWVMVTVLATQHKVRFFASPDLKRWETLVRLRAGGRDRRRVGVSRPVPAACRRQRRRRCAGSSTSTSTLAAWPADPAGSTSSGRSTARGSSTRTRRRRRCGPTTARTSTRRLSFSDIPPTDGRRIWMAWISNWQYANEEPTVDLARRPIGAARTGASSAARRHSSGAAAGCRAARAADVGEPVAVVEPTTLPESAEIELEFERGSLEPGGHPAVEPGGRRGDRRRDVESARKYSSTGGSRALTPVHRDYPGRHAGPGPVARRPARASRPLRPLGRGGLRQ